MMRRFAVVFACFVGLLPTYAAEAPQVPVQDWRDVDPNNLVLIDTRYGEVAVELAPEDSESHRTLGKILSFRGRIERDCAGLNGAERWPLEAVVIHKTPAGLNPILIPSSPQSLNFFSNSMCGLFCLLDFSLIWGSR